MVPAAPAVRTEVAPEALLAWVVLEVPAVLVVLGVPVVPVAAARP